VRRQGYFSDPSWFFVAGATLGEGPKKTAFRPL